MATTYAGQREPDTLRNLIGRSFVVGVTVKVAGTSTLATLYTDRARTSVLANPLPTNVVPARAGVDSYGNYTYWAEPGVYDEYVGSTKTVTVTVSLDPSEPAAFQPLYADQSVIAGLDSSTVGVLASDGGGWFNKTYAALKTALGLSKGDVGLGNVDNTSDANKPVSTAQQAAITAAVNGLINGAPGALDTLNELATALGDDANFATTVTNALAAKAPLASPTFTGTATAPALSASGITGATSFPATLAGGTASGAPTTGAHTKGELVPDATGALWLCTVAGTPGTWVQIGGSDATALKIASNLSDVANAGTARTNLGLGTAATHPATDFASKWTLSTKTGDYTAVDGDYLLLDPTSASFTVTLPTATAGRQVVLVLATASGHTVTITGTVNGVVNPVLYAKGTSLWLTADGTEWKTSSVHRLPEARSLWGDGSDGVVTISGTTTLTRDMMYDTLTVQSGGVLKHANFRVYVKNLCWVQAGGIMSNDANAASGATAGTSTAGGTLRGSLAGAAGGTGVGTNGTSATGGQSAGGAGGNGGASATPNAGGTGGGATFTAAWDRVLKHAPECFLLNAISSTTVGCLTGGGSGAAGGGDGTNAGGGGGAGASALLLNARVVRNDGTIRCNGGNGGNGVAGTAGGGGGGGGGLLVENTTDESGSGVWQANGGTHGTAAGAGVNGGDGAVGTIQRNVWGV